jgi:hypothetical protein
MGLSTYDEVFAIDNGYIFTNGSGITTHDLVPQVTSDTRIDVILASNNDTIPHVIFLLLGTGSNMFIVGSVSVPAGTGFAGTPTVDILAACLPAAMVGIVIPNGARIQGQLLVAMVGAYLLETLALGGQI